MHRKRVGCALALGVLLCAVWASRPSANEEFPFGRELLLDTRPMKGSKRIPGIEIDSDGMAAIDLWCNTMQGRAIVSADAITISTGEKTDRPCARSGRRPTTISPRRSLRSRIGVGRGKAWLWTVRKS